MHHTTSIRNIGGILLEGLKPGGGGDGRDVHFLPYHETNPQYEYDTRKGDVSIYPGVRKLFEKHNVYCSSIGTILVCETIDTDCFSRVEILSPPGAPSRARIVWSAGAGLPMECLAEPDEYNPKAPHLTSRRWSRAGGAYCPQCSSGFVPHTIECIKCGLKFKMSIREADHGIDPVTDYGRWPSVTYPDAGSRPGADREEAGCSSDGVDPLSGVVAMPDSDTLAAAAASSGEAPAAVGVDDIADDLATAAAASGEAPAAAGDDDIDVEGSVGPGQRLRTHKGRTVLGENVHTSKRRKVIDAKWRQHPEMRERWGALGMRRPVDQYVDLQAGEEPLPLSEDRGMTRSLPSSPGSRTMSTRPSPCSTRPSGMPAWRPTPRTTRSYLVCSSLKTSCRMA